MIILYINDNISINFQNDNTIVTDTKVNFKRECYSTHEVYDALLETTLTREESSQIDAICDKISLLDI